MLEREYSRDAHEFYFPIDKARMVGYRKNLWVLFGSLVNAR